MDTFLNLRELSEYLSKNRGKNTAITFHSIGDRDGVASAIAISHLLSNAAIVTPDFITNNAKRMLENSGSEVKIQTEFPKYLQQIIVVDANRLELLGKFEKELLNFPGEILFIDHHAVPDNTGFGGRVYIFNSEDYNSASSIAYQVMKQNNVQVKKDVAYLLINGIVSDSADFQNSSPLVFRQISELLELSGLSYPEVVETARGPASPEIRNRILKDLFAASMEVCGDYLIISGQSQFQANTAAETALRLGADAAVFWTIKSDGVTMSARLRSPLDKKLQLHLGKMLEVAAKLMGGTGGGHPCAAGAYGKDPTLLVNTTKSMLDQIRKRFLQENKK